MFCFSCRRKFGNSLPMQLMDPIGNIVKAHHRCAKYLEFQGYKSVKELTVLETQMRQKLEPLVSSINEKSAVQDTRTHPERIWWWLKDHKDKTAKEIAVAISLGQVQVQTLLWDMYNRGMVSRHKETRTVGGRQPIKEVYIFNVTNPKFYEVLPLPKKFLPAPAQASDDLQMDLSSLKPEPTPPAPAQAAPKVSPPTESGRMMDRLVNWSFGEVMQLHQELNEKFKR